MVLIRRLVAAWRRRRSGDGPSPWSRITKLPPP
jgi:hypothetical protein